MQTKERRIWDYLGTRMHNTIQSSTSNSIPTFTIVVACGLIALFAIFLGLVSPGDYEKDWSIATHMTARAALLVFGFVFAWQTLPKNIKSRLVVHSLFLGFSLIHFIHLATLLIFLTTTPRDYDLIVVMLGAPAYAMLVAMTLISIRWGHSPLPPTLAKFHAIGLWYSWLIFTLTYLSITLEGQDVVTGVLGLTFCTTVLAFRFSSMRKTSSTS